MKSFIKIFLLLFISFALVYFMHSKNILNFQTFSYAFENNKKYLVLIAFLQILNCLFMTFRYHSLLKLFGIKANLQNVTAATYVSNGIGLWMPGSMAIIEFIRISLMLGANHKLNGSYTPKINKLNNNLEELATKSKLAAASLFDRLIGLFVMLFFGCLMTFFVYMKSFNINNSKSDSNLLILFLISFFLMILIIIVPYLAKSLLFRRILARIERLFLTVFRNRVINLFLKKIFAELNSVLDVISLGIRSIKSFWMPVIYSIVCLVLAVFGTYFSGIAISSNIPLEAIFATVSLLSIASLIPMGFGGVGGMQLTAVLLFSIFNISPQIASSAQLLQTTVNLLAITGVGLLFARLSAGQIRAILDARKKESVTS
ncbi:lysylphosphatidylglycerol synthase domain-containing protein [Fluviispira multicolorata]|uniref:Lysylphosphatidylglycerol synthase TM region n=1 Tax=Fluviispira multicolorata TaxID=2654512 RepID=A0A833N6R9_9BACT|nr:lysylphosphatidylglycerol synthase domain-containing protein [Fluviispira multicolorata]KAB8030833.1 hypothetical protein GCL57_07615 [Fluviispira multicolorata]